MFVKTETVQIQATDGADVAFSVADSGDTFPGENMVRVGIITTSPLGNNVFWSGYWATVPGLTSAERTEMLGLVLTARNAMAATVEGYNPNDPSFTTLDNTYLEDFPDLPSTLISTQVPLTAGGRYVYEAQLDDAFGSNRARLDELIGKIRRGVLLATPGWSEV